MQPLDVVKTRLQIVGADSGMASCIKNTYKNEGMLGFYKVKFLVNIHCSKHN